ncbi:class I SAM-dependent methyltransferase [Flavobacterium sp. UBA6031]|uniref:class I SAM-dependent methyltransferase n=1 Tax=Flavobacterium sp. UBA6031 TaxID=1946551 RepID=UPI0025C73930|nr:class I SAM-dependent methyltransferase [Flavobacterium sp. UBA6031]
MNTTEKNPFDPIAKEYDQWFDDNKNTFHSELEALKYFLPTQGRGVEIGVGTGRFASELGISHGIEPSESMAILAKQRGIEVIISKAEKLPYENKSFDFAIMVAVDPFVEDIEKVYSEIARILKTGGRLIVGSLHRDGDVASKYMSMTDSEVYKSANFYTVAETIQQLTLTGFSDFKTCQTLFSISPTEVETPELGHGKGSFVAIKAVKTN